MSPSSPENRLLATLSPHVKAGFLADCSLVTLRHGEVLYDVGDTIRHVYFPVRSFISMLVVVNDHVLEVGLVGNEGMCGYATILGNGKTGMRALTQGAGDAWRMTSTAFRAHMKKTPELSRLVYGYMNIVIDQLAQSAACNRFHVVEERLARRLLMTRDRAQSDSLDVTQEFLAFMLGIRRVGVTKAARSLRDRQLIQYQRGAVHIIDATNLQLASCECYQVDLDIYTNGMRTPRDNSGA